MNNNDGYFKLTDYDCLGFDLDHTLARYKVGHLIELEYKFISEFFVSKEYSSEHLFKPIDHNFFLKGLILDDENGNIIRVNSDGKILQGCHGTKFLTDEEILEYYPNRRWNLTDAFSRDPLSFPSRDFVVPIKNLTDYFDVSYSLAFARAVDCVDEKNGKSTKHYGILSHLQEALNELFDWKNFEKNAGPLYPELVKNPGKFYYKCSENIKSWLKALKQRGKLLFLITSSHCDFAAFTASYVLGENWQDYFDIVICFSGKPKFFYDGTTFLESENRIIPAASIELNKVYIHGNWDDLYKTFKQRLGKCNPKVIYFGDNLIQDVYVPSVYKCCDTVAICEELEAEGIDEHPQWHPDEQFLLSTQWGSYFSLPDGTKTNSFQIITTYSKLCVPSIEYVASLPIEHNFRSNTFEP